MIEPVFLIFGAIDLAVGRIVLSVFFLLCGVTKIARNKTIVGISVLTDFQARIAAAILVVYLIPTTLVFHNFWAAIGAEKQNQGVHFMKNVAIMGGLLILASIA